MYIKVACACGCRYGFDVVPVNGLMPVGVNCPKCGLDGTFKADSLIALGTPKNAKAPAVAGVLAGIPLPEDPTPAPVPVALPLPATPLPVEPAPVITLPPSRPPAVALSPITDEPVVIQPIQRPAIAAASALPPPPPAVAAALPLPPAPVSGLSVKRRAPEAHQSPPPVPTPVATGSESPAPVSSGFKIKGVAPSAHEPAAVVTPGFKPLEPEPVAEKKLADPHVHMSYMPKDGPIPSFPRGVLGAFIGTVVGSIIWYTIYYFGDIDFGWLALLPAVMSGMLGRKMAREDNHWIGVTAAVFTLIAIFGTRYAIASKEMDKEMGGLDTEAIFETYDKKLAEAKEAVAAKTDEDIKNFLQNQHRRQFEKFAEKGEKFQPMGIQKEDVEDFKEMDLPEYQDFANGKPSREEYERDIKQAKQAGTWATRIFTILQVIIFTGLFGILSLIFAMVVAYRTGSG